jgi:hypothetical protein
VLSSFVDFSVLSSFVDSGVLSSLIDCENGSFHLRDFGLEVLLQLSDFFEENVRLDCGLLESSFVSLFRSPKPIIEQQLFVLGQELLDLK